VHHDLLRRGDLVGTLLPLFHTLFADRAAQMCQSLTRLTRNQWWTDTRFAPNRESLVWFLVLFDSQRLACTNCLSPTLSPTRYLALLHPIVGHFRHIHSLMCACSLSLFVSSPLSAYPLTLMRMCSQGIAPTQEARRSSGQRPRQKHLRPALQGR
jgi:hypothetical protein